MTQPTSLPPRTTEASLQDHLNDHDALHALYTAMGGRPPTGGGGGGGGTGGGVGSGDLLPLAADTPLATLTFEEFEVGANPGGPGGYPVSSSGPEPSAAGEIVDDAPAGLTKSWRLPKNTLAPTGNKDDATGSVTFTVPADALGVDPTRTLLVKARVRYEAAPNTYGGFNHVLRVTQDQTIEDPPNWLYGSAGQASSALMRIGTDVNADWSEVQFLLPAGTSKFKMEQVNWSADPGGRMTWDDTNAGWRLADLTFYEVAPGTEGEVRLVEAEQRIYNFGPSGWVPVGDFTFEDTYDWVSLRSPAANWQILDGRLYVRDLRDWAGNPIVGQTAKAADPVVVQTSVRGPLGIRENALPALAIPVQGTIGMVRIALGTAPDPGELRITLRVIGEGGYNQSLTEFRVEPGTTLWSFDYTTLPQVDRGFFFAFDVVDGGGLNGGPAGNAVDATISIEITPA